MYSVIREFYLGNLSPDTTTVKRNSELGKAMREMSEAETFLRENLGGENLAALERLVAAQLATSTTTAEESYVDGFRTGAKFMLDILAGRSDNLTPLV